jgi:hypothetical protein
LLLAAVAVAGAFAPESRSRARDAVS